MRPLLRCAAVVAAGTLVLAGAGAGASGAATSTSPVAPRGTLTIANALGSLWICDFNPFITDEAPQSLGPVYEPLAFVDTLRNDRATPWLATRWAWDDGNRTLAFTIRRGVRFTDGRPLTPADVVFTFQLMKRFRALDTNAIWSVLSSVSQQGAQVVMRFRTPAVSWFYAVADQVGIVPQHIWAKVAHPVTYADANPIGTGAFTVGRKGCTPENITYQANPRYWQPGLPKVRTVHYPAFIFNYSANLALARGQAQWGSQFIPSIKQFYVDRHPKKFHYWFPPLADNSLFINLKNSILRSPAVRRAMAFAISRRAASKTGEYGYEPPSDQAGIVTPTFSSWLDRRQAAAFDHDYAYDPARAIRILRAAGFRRGRDGIFARDGHRLSFTIVNNGDFSDWVATINVIIGELQRVGIRVKPEDLPAASYFERLTAGHFELAYSSEPGGPSPYYELRQLLYSPNSAPIGQPATSDFERYSSPATDQLITAYEKATSPAGQHRLVNRLELVMLKDVPVIPVTESVDWYEYDTGAFTGWPTRRHPYAQPSAYDYPDWGQVLLHLVHRQPT